MTACFRKIVPSVGMYGFVSFPDSLMLEATPFSGRERQLRRNRLFPVWLDWEEGTEITVLAQSSPRDYVVRDRQGIECEMPLLYIDVGWEIELDGEWQHEFSPRALQYYEQQIPLLQAELDATPPKAEAYYALLLEQLTEYRSRLEMHRHLEAAELASPEIKESQVMIL